MSTIFYYGNLKFLHNKMPTPNGMEIKNEIKITEKKVKKMGPIW